MSAAAAPRLWIPDILIVVSRTLWQSAPKMAPGPGLRSSFVFWAAAGRAPQLEQVGSVLLGPHDLVGDRRSAARHRADRA